MVDNNLKLQYNINNLTSAIKNLKSKHITHADSYFYSKNNHDRFELEMLIGIDILQYFLSLVLNQFGGGTCFKMNGKLIPLGNVNNFLSLEQMNEYRCNLNDITCSNN